MNRAELAEQAGINKETLRYYERIGLLPEPRRDTNNYRVYNQKDLERLQFIRKAKEYGFTLKELKSYWAYKTSADRGDLEGLIRAMLQKKKEETHERMEFLKKQAQFLEQIEEQLNLCPVLNQKP